MRELLSRIDFKWSLGIVIALIGLWFAWDQYRRVEPDPSIRIIESDLVRIDAILRSVSRTSSIASGQLAVSPPDMNSFQTETDPAFLQSGSMQAHVGLTANTANALRSAELNITKMRVNLSSCQFLDQKALGPLRIVQSEYKFVADLLEKELIARQEKQTSEYLAQELKAVLVASGRDAWVIRYNSFISC